ncbi:MAG: MFS transporter [Betaproteobacteria bacterium]|nr:MFS transporter [Betaproteobacteria bacterium]
MKGVTKPRLFYGWNMVWASFGLQMVQAGLLQQSLGAYIAVLREEFGWGKAALAGAAVIQQVENALLGPIQGWLVDRFGSSIMVRCGVIALGLGFMLFSQVETLTGFYAAFVLIALGSGFSGFFPLTIAVMHWFEKKRARALSTMNLGGACGGMLAPLVALSMLSFGWRTTAFASGVIIILVGFPLATVIRRRPEDMGEVVDGLSASAGQPVATTVPASATSPAEPAARPDFTAAQAIRTSTFWFISLGHGLSLLVVSAVNVHAITHLKEGLGYELDAAALVMGLMTAGQFTGILLAGAIGDRYDKRLLSAGCTFFHMAGMLLLTFATSAVMLVGFAVLHGVAWGLRGPLMQAMRADYFGRTAIGLIAGLSFMIVLVGQVIGPLFAGALADATGNYQAGFTTLALLAGLGSVFFLLVKPPVRHR